ncbi:MAG: hypothetical protein JWM95_46 [Gemmatimonadetes bacterium]|nr:hypothetical protein [Gemmatimonadota bacterium]
MPSRFLLHPLKGGGSLTAVAPGRFEPIRNAAVLNDIELTETADLARRGRISSIPTPWARMQLFRDAIVNDEFKHPFHDEAVNGVLDTLELTLFQEHIDGFDLQARSVNLALIEQTAAANAKDGIVKFADALADLAPTVNRKSKEKLKSLHIIVAGKARNSPIVCATSPFTLFFTPETRHVVIPGYYEPHRALRPLSQRPPALAWYVRDVLLPQLTGASNPGAALPEMQALVNLFNKQLTAVELPAEQFQQTLRTRVSSIEPVEGIQLLHLIDLLADSPLQIRGTRNVGGVYPPLVIDNSGNARQRKYFAWLSRPDGIDVDGKTMDRGVLPGTPWRIPWIEPTAEFLADELIILDSPLNGDRIFGAGSEQAPLGASADALKVLLPLKPRYFDFFAPADVHKYLNVKAGGAGNAMRVDVTLTIPTAGGDVVVSKSYSGGDRFDSSLSMWPGFVVNAPVDPAEGTPVTRWKDYYLIHDLQGGHADEVSIAIGTADNGRTDSDMRQFVRAEGTSVHHVSAPPAFIHIRTRRHGHSAEGVILPRLRALDAPTDTPWQVAIDFGTSNTVVAYRPVGSSNANEAKPLAITQATRFDLTQGTSQGVTTFFDTFFYPTPNEGKPFATVILKGRTELASAEAIIPGLTANIPFRGEVVGGDAGAGRFSNEIVDNLKWGGGGADTKRLTKLFLHQVLQLVYAEALGRGVKTAGMRIRWSFPIAFSTTKLETMEQQWRANVQSFAQTIGHAAILEKDVSSVDESTASMRYFSWLEPLGRDSFSKSAKALKLTCDVGGGTTDVTAYALGNAVFRSSMLFGGRDLIGHSDDERSIFRHIYRWARENGLRRSTDSVIERYPSDHARFSYLVRLPWFEEQKGNLAAEPWFADVQACILYFYSSILYNIGLRLRTVNDTGIAPPDMIFFGGNGASYLNWLTQFNPWNSSRLAPAYTEVLRSALERGFGKSVQSVKIQTSGQPKMEVVLGLLIDGNDDRVTEVDSTSPVGESIVFAGGSRAAGSQLILADLKGSLGSLSYTLPFPQWEISEFNRSFIESLGTLVVRADTRWRGVEGRVRTVLAECTEDFYDNQVKSELGQLSPDEVGSISLFTVEAARTLRHLERQLFGTA